MGRNPDYFEQVRARGVCHLCRRAMRDEDPRLAHLECGRLQRRGWTSAQIRKNPPVLGELQPYWSRLRFGGLR